MAFQLEIQISLLLKAAREHYSYANYIFEYPKLNGYKDYDLTSDLDIFYRNTCNVFFNDSLLLTDSLLSKNKKVMSFWNWIDFKSSKLKELEKITDHFVDTGLKKVRNQVVGHVDFKNPNNNNPLNRRRAIINEKLIILLDEVQQMIMLEFYDFTSKQVKPYSPQYFETATSTIQIKSLMNIAKPKMTNGTII